MLGKICNAYSLKEEREVLDKEIIITPCEIHLGF